LPTHIHGTIAVIGQREELVTKDETIKVTDLRQHKPTKFDDELVSLLPRTNRDHAFSIWMNHNSGPDQKPDNVMRKDIKDGVTPYHPDASAYKAS
jgi:hypothetical protein